MRIRKVVVSVSVILVIAIVTLWHVYDSRALDRYEGSYIEVKGKILRSTYIGKRELFGPARFEIELDNGQSYIVVSRERPPLFHEGDSIALHIPKEQRFVQDDKQVCNKFTVERADRTRFD